MYQLLWGAVTPAQWMSLQNSHWYHNTDNLNAAFTFPCVKGLTKCVCAFVSQLSLIIAICWHSFCHFPKTPFRAFGGHIKDKKDLLACAHNDNYTNKRKHQHPVVC